MPDIIALGELLIDFVPTVSGVALIEAPAFIKAPGGAPANVAVGLARLGAASGFMGQVGDDAFGHFLAQTLRENGVDVSALRFSTAARTALAEAQVLRLQDLGERAGIVDLGDVDVARAHARGFIRPQRSHAPDMMIVILDIAITAAG